MPEKTKPREDIPEEKEAQETFLGTDEANWAKDQREKSYYYDDGHGYEIYNPDEDEQNEE
jgi:hypothetical protein